LVRKYYPDYKEDFKARNKVLTMAGELIGFIYEVKSTTKKRYKIGIK